MRRSITRRLARESRGIDWMLVARWLLAALTAAASLLLLAGLLEVSRG